MYNDYSVSFHNNINNNSNNNNNKNNANNAIITNKLKENITSLNSLIDENYNSSKICSPSNNINTISTINTENKNNSTILSPFINTNNNNNK